MSAEFIRRRLVTRIGGNNKNTVIDALCNFFGDFEGKVGEVEEIEAQEGEYLRFRIKDGTRYEVYNWVPYVDVAESKKKGIELQPLAYRLFNEEEAGGGGRNLFGSFFNADISIIWFCIFAVWLGLVVSGIVVAKAVFFK
ncbi:MAG: hypothetical protein LBH25_06405 [Fibromonadaceae bacterium]|jgi:hypothetical protein|nr:hypothetical protein [Fibromonadaceae bacterium]